MEFEVMVTFPELLYTVVEDYNNFHKTDFKIMEVFDEEVPFCKIQVSNFRIEDIFSLGFCLARDQYTLRYEGKLEW